MNRKQILLALLLGVSLVSGCRKKDRDDEGTSKTAAAKPPPPPPRPAAPAAPQVDVPFQGKYSKVAEATWKNGRRVRVDNANGAATLHVEGGKVTYSQTYTARGKVNHVTQVYTFTQQQVKPVMGGYDVAMTFQTISGDTAGYSPDKNNPKIEARKQAGGWEIGLLTTDNNGVMGGVEFK